MGKPGAIVSIIIWSVIGTALLAILVVGIIFRGHITVFKEYGEGNLHEIYTDSKNADEFNSIQISWRSGNVQVFPSQDDQMHLTQRSYYNVSALNCSVSGGSLTIDQNSDIGIFILGFGYRSSDLELTLPQKQYKEFILKMSSGNTDVTGISADTMNYNLTSGNIEANSLQAKSLAVQETSGKIIMNKVQADSLTAETTSGDMTVNGSFSAIQGRTTSGTVKIATAILPKELDANMTSGNVSITIPENDGFTINCKKTSGTFRSDFDLANSINDDKNMYRYLSGGLSDLRYTAEMTSGDFELLKAR